MFLYFIPDHPKGVVARADMEAVGLGYALGAGDPDSRKLNGAGPDGRAGFVVTVPAAPDSGEACRVETLYQPADQVWRKGPGGRYWVGYWKSRRPKPEGLRRTDLIAGERAKLRDGTEWVVPVARSIVRGSTLPKELVLGDDFKTWETRELGEFFELCAAAERILDVFRSAKSDDEGKATYYIEYSDGMPVVIMALAVNYRVSALEVSMLGLTDPDMWQVLRALCDVPMVERIVAERQQKKTPASESSPTDAGSPASSPITSPPSAT